MSERLSYARSARGWAVFDGATELGSVERDSGMPLFWIAILLDGHPIRDVDGEPWWFRTRHDAAQAVLRMRQP